MNDQDIYFIEMMRGILEPEICEMTHEQAAQEAMADYRTGRQAEMMGDHYESF